jgi:cytoskeletal protein RodZ
MLRRFSRSSRLGLALVFVVGVVAVGLATWAYAGPAGAHPGMGCNPDPGHGSPGCHVDEPTTTTTVVSTTTTKLSTTTTKPSTSTTKASTSTTKASTSTTVPGTSTTGATTTTTGAGTATTGAGTATSQAGTSTTEAGTSTTAAAVTATTDAGAATQGTATQGTDTSVACRQCHLGVGPDFAASLPGHIHSNQSAFQGVYYGNKSFAALTGTILAGGLLIVATSISLRGLARIRRRAALRNKKGQ